MTRKRILKVAGVVLGILVLLGTALHFWFVNNAEKVIEDLVTSKSKGKLRLKVENMKFNYFSKKIELRDVVFYTTDSADEHTNYRFSVERVNLRAKAILPLLFNKQLLIDSLYLEAPDMQVTRLKRSENRIKKDNKDVSVTEEMGRIYNSIQDAIRTLEVDRFEFNNGRFTLVNKIEPENKPFVITNLHFFIDNLQLDSTAQQEKVLFSDQIFLTTSNQDIVFPDGLHRLAFKDFRINVKNQLIEFDSCTISGQKPGNSRSNFIVFFDTLRLVNLDFKALYQSELIKADSVYCLNPDFKITLEEGTKQRNLPELDSIIHQFTGDMQLGYVGVINADIDITTYRDEQPNSFSSRNNSFELKGLIIDHTLTQPITVEGFAMAIRDYENFLKDSSYTLRFDSIVLRENRIVLSNFSVHSMAGNVPRNIHVSQFELSGLSWPHLVFNRTLKAQEAFLYNPQINYTPRPNRKKEQRQNIFRALGDLNEFMELGRLSIINGNIKLRLGKSGNFDLQNTYMTVKSNELLGSKGYRHIEQSVEALRFGRGLIRIGGLLIELNNAEFVGASDQLSVEKARVYTGKQTINATIRNILVDDIVFDEANAEVVANNLSWQHAKVEINENDKTAGNNKSSFSLLLTGIEGKNTAVMFNGNKIQLNAFLTQLSADHIVKEGNLETNGFAASGNLLQIETDDSRLDVKSFGIHDGLISTLRSVTFHKQTTTDTINARIPSVQFIPNINELMNGDIKLSNVSVHRPAIYVVSTKNDSGRKMELPRFQVDNLTIDEPELQVIAFRNGSNRTINWTGNRNSLHLGNINSPGNGLISIGRLTGRMSGISFNNSSQENYSTGPGQIDLSLENISLATRDSIAWSMRVNKAGFSNLRLDTLGEKIYNVDLHNAELSNVSLNSKWLSNLPNLINRNAGLQIKNATFSFSDANNNYRLYNLNIDNPGKSAGLDSFAFQPHLGRDSFISKNPWQTDYMTLRTGSMKISGFDAIQNSNDSSFKAKKITIDDPVFTTYRDKRKPFRAGIIKPLPTRLIQNIPFPAAIDTLSIVNGKITYTELNNKTQEEGKFLVTGISGEIFPISNERLDPSDSLNINLSGYLMDSAWLHLRVRESYADTAGGFLMTVRMRPGSLTYLNPALIPLASLKLKSGYLDTLYMRAYGKDFLSFGEMRMHYHDLRVEFIRNGNETKKGLLSGLMTFIANRFVIRKQNQNRVGTVYFPRLRDRSFINYYIKITMSGVATSVGAKKSRKLVRKYEKEMGRRQLPPYEFGY